MARRMMSWGLAAAAGVLWAGAAAASPEGSLDRCQKTVNPAADKFVSGKIKAVEGCLAKVSKQIIASNAPDADGAAGSCVSSFRRLQNTADPTKTLVAAMTAKIIAACDPATPGVEHVLSDILGTGAGVSEPINAENINTWCARFGGDGAINTLQEWIDCIVAANECAADATIATHYPRVLEWLDEVRPAMLALVPPPNDAVAALDAVNNAIEGGNNDNIPSLQCGSACGDGVKNSNEQCDGSDLGGATCASLGFAGGTLACDASCAFDPSGCNVVCGTCGNGVRDGFESCDGPDLGGASCLSLGFVSGTLTCTAGCGFDVSGCYAAAFPATGQTAQYVGNDDGSLGAGATLSYTDNGDGTITDNNTGLMWEKKVRLDGSANGADQHDADNSYVWAGTCSSSAALCGVDADCGGGQTCAAGSPIGYFVGATIYQWLADLNAANFAGHNDWRVPNVKELQSIVSYGANTPAVAAAFHGASCGAGCPDMTSPACSCTRSWNYWSSTTFAGNPYDAWIVYFGYGNVSADHKPPSDYALRAVRGGL